VDVVESAGIGIGMARTKAADVSQGHCGYKGYAAGLSLLYITVFYGLLVSWMAERQPTTSAEA
jgi:hypothetical protein